MRKMEKRMKESIALGIVPILAITFSDQVSTSEYAGLVTSNYELPGMYNNYNYFKLKDINILIIYIYIF